MVQNKIFGKQWQGKELIFCICLVFQSLFIWLLQFFRKMIWLVIFISSSLLQANLASTYTHGLTLNIQYNFNLPKQFWSRVNKQADLCHLEIWSTLPKAMVQHTTVHSEYIMASHQPVSFHFDCNLGLHENPWNICPIFIIVNLPLLCI